MRKTGITLQNSRNPPMGRNFAWLTSERVLNKTCDAIINKNYIFNINMVYLVYGAGSNDIISILTAFITGCRGWDSINRQIDRTDHAVPLRFFADIFYLRERSYERGLYLIAVLTAV